MFIKQLFNGGDYDVSLRQRRWAAIALLSVGLVGFACWFLLVPDSDLSDHAQGFYLGAATGITVGALLLLVRTQYLLTHPQARRKARIQETDERQLHITRSAAQIAGGITIFGVALSLFVVLPLSREAYCALFCTLMLYIAAFFASSWWLSKKL